MNQIGMVRKNGMAGITFFKLQVVEKRLDENVMVFHKKTIAAR
jgi:hypothetical protein